MENANEQFSIQQSCNVGIDSSVEETIWADPASSTVASSRKISGTGDAHLKQILRTTDIQVIGEILIANAASYSFAGDGIVGPESIFLFQDCAAFDGRSESTTSASIEGRSIAQYAGVADGSILIDQSIGAAQGITAFQSISAIGNDPMAASVIGEMTFDASSGIANGDGCLVGLQVNGQGEIGGAIGAAMIGSSMAMMGLGLQASGPGQSLATLAFGQIDYDLDTGEMEVSGISGSLDVDGGFLSVDGILAGELLGSAEGMAAFEMAASGERMLSSIAAGDFSLDRGSYRMNGDGAMMSLAAEGRFEAGASLGAAMRDDLLNAFSSRAWSSGEGDLLAGGVAGSVGIDLQSGTLQGKGCLVGLAGSGPGSSLDSLEMIVSQEGEETSAVGQGMSAAGGKSTIVLAGASEVSGPGIEIDLSIGRIRANSALVSATGSGMAISGGELLYARRDGQGIDACGYGMQSRGSENAMALAGVGRMEIEVIEGSISSQGSVAGGMAGLGGEVTSEYLGSQSSGIYMKAEGYELLAKSESAAFIASGAARGKGNLVEIEVGDSRLGSDGSIAAVAAAGSGRVYGGYLNAISGSLGDMVDAQYMSGMGSNGAVAAMGYGKSMIDLAVLSIRADGAINAVGGSIEGEVVATDMSSGKDLLGIYAQGSGLKSSGKDGVGVAAGVDCVLIDFDDGIFHADGMIDYAGGNTYLMAEADGLNSGSDFLGMYAYGEGLNIH